MTANYYFCVVIKSFRNKKLTTLFALDKSKIDLRLQKRILLRLDILDMSSSTDGLAIHGYDFHALKGFKAARYRIHINGP